MLEDVVQLKCGVKHDPWGKKGKESLAGKLWSQTPGSSEVDDSETYSEMWMGTYPTVPARLLRSGETLEHYLKRKPELVGQSVQQKFGDGVPFLPKVSNAPVADESKKPVNILGGKKVLSFDKALPLQVHPDKRLAEQLNLVDPENFSDPNHKPEIAVALTEFELFAGFKPLSDIEALMKIKPLDQYVHGHATFDDGLLRQICKTFLSLPPETVAETVKQLSTMPLESFGEHKYIPGLLERLSKQYSESDNGTLVAALLMNYLTLQPGEAVCVPADSLHAYLRGDILECMARSDNVLATGFCPRASRNNVDLFARALSFEPHNVDEAKLAQRKSERGELGKTVEYAPPFSEFNVLATSLRAGEKERHKPVGGPSIIVVTSGSGDMVISDEKKLDLQSGYVFFVGEGVELEFSTSNGMDLYRPYAE